MAPFVAPPNFNPKADSDYGYIPDRWPSFAFLVLFGLTGLLHLGQATRYRLWWLFPTVVLAAAGETLGWSARFWSSYNDGTEQTPYLIQICATIIAPTPFLAAYFILLGRLIAVLGEEYSRLSARLYTRIFTSIDVLCLVIQAAGGGIASGNSTSNNKLGGNIMLAGIILQLISLVFYITLGTEFLVRFHKNRPLRARSDSEPADFSASSTTVVATSYGTAKRLFNLDGKTKQLLFGMILSIGCIFIRGVYRTAELADGWRGVIITTQTYFFIFDGLMILIAMISLNVFHPGRLLSRSSERLSGSFQKGDQ